MSTAPSSPFSGEKPECLNILVVDDTRMFRELARSALEAIGHVVFTCESGPEAISAVRERPYDVVLMDIQMPGMNGVEATQRIRALPDRAPEERILAYTTLKSESRIDEYRSLGFDGFLEKPATIRELRAAIASEY